MKKLYAIVLIIAGITQNLCAMQKTSVDGHEVTLFGQKSANSMRVIVPKAGVDRFPVLVEKLKRQGNLSVEDAFIVGTNPALINDYFASSCDNVSEVEYLKKISVDEQSLLKPAVKSLGGQIAPRIGKYQDGGQETNHQLISLVAGAKKKNDPYIQINKDVFMHTPGIQAMDITLRDKIKGVYPFDSDIADAETLLFAARYIVEANNENSIQHLTAITPNWTKIKAYVALSHLFKTANLKGYGYLNQASRFVGIVTSRLFKAAIIIAAGLCAARYINQQ